MPPIPVGVQKLAAQLARRMPWLARERHIGALAKLLHRHHLDADAGWSAERLLHALEIHNRTTGHSVPDPTKQRNPLGYLHTLLTAAAPQLPEQHHTHGAWRRPAELAAWQLEDQVRREQIAAEDPARVAAIIAEIRAQIAAEQTAQPRLSRVPAASRSTGTARSPR